MEKNFLDYNRIMELKDQYKLAENIIPDGKEKGIIKFRENGSIFHVPSAENEYYMMEADVTDYREIAQGAAMVHHLEVFNSGYEDKIREAVKDAAENKKDTIFCIPSGNTLLNPENGEDYPHLIYFFTEDSLAIILSSLRRNPDNRKQAD